MHFNQLPSGLNMLYRDGHVNLVKYNAGTPMSKGDFWEGRRILILTSIGANTASTPVVWADTPGGVTEYAEEFELALTRSREQRRVTLCRYGDYPGCASFWCYVPE
jgi:hypothetical protein